MNISWDGVCLDCRDAEELAAFYERLLGFREAFRDGPDFIHLDDPRGGMSINIRRLTFVLGGISSGIPTRSRPESQSPS